jgi:hypothetical protein
MLDGIGKVNNQAQAVKIRPDVYQSDSIREVRERAQAIQQKSTPEERNNLTRLNQALGQEEPLKDNVPRGYYLNISI